MSFRIKSTHKFLDNVGAKTSSNPKVATKKKPKQQNIKMVHAKFSSKGLVIKQSIKAQEDYM